MRVPGLVFASWPLVEQMLHDRALEQVANVAWLPGIVGHSIAMPDAHWGYGFPIGGVAAVRPDEGVISPGGVGYDIACGVRLIRSDLEAAEVRGLIPALTAALGAAVPSGLGVPGHVETADAELKRIFLKGAGWAKDRGMATEADLQRIEDGGTIPGADPEHVSTKAFERGHHQAGTLGSGNHFLELQEVAEVFDPGRAAAFGLAEGQLCCMVHCGSRGVGHQVATDHLKRMDGAMKRHGIEVPDRELACAPIHSREGEAYLAAMACAANFALNNRQVITHFVRRTFERIFNGPWERLGLELVYDVAHNIAKFEEHAVDGRSVELCVHRKGATRALPPGHPALPVDLRAAGQPVIIPGDMGSASYVLAGGDASMRLSWGSSCHGAGRAMSRHQAKKHIDPRELRRRMEELGVAVVAGSDRGLVEEAPEAYKDVNEVVRVVDGLGIASKVARLKPLGVVKGT